MRFSNGSGSDGDADSGVHSSATEQTTQAKPNGRRVVRLFRPYRWRLALVVLLIGVSALLSLASPFLLRAVIDQAIPERDLHLLALLVLGMVAVAVGSSVLDVLQTWLSTVVGQRVMHDLRTSVYRHLQRLPMAFFTRTRTGEVQSRIANDIGGMQAVLTTTLTQIISSSTTVIGTLVAMLALDWRLTLLSLLLVPVFVWISRSVGAQRQRITAQRQHKMAGLTALVEESLSVSGMLLAKTMGQSRALGDRFERQSGEVADLEVRSSMAGRWRQSTIQMIFGVLPAMIYLVAGVVMAGGATTITIGTLVAFTTLQNRLFMPLMTLLRLAVEVQSSLALFARVFEYLDLPVTITERSDARALHRSTVSGEIRLDDVHFRYDPEGPLTLQDIDLTVPGGGTVAVVGATGSGKTTLGYLMARLYDVEAGSVSIDGVDVRDLDFASLSSVVGIVSQETYLFHASVAENLRFAKPDATAAELVDAARGAQIHELIEEMPDGYDTVVGERGYRFSGGEKQRLAIARTLLRNPPILVLDEATSALDTRTELAVQQALDSLAAGRTTIAIAHRLSTVRDADEIVVLSDGEIAERGTHAELLARDGVYADLVLRDTVASGYTEIAEDAGV